MSAIPGLVDCHTHTVWAGSRVDEFDRRAQGQPYEQIAAAGGGIKATVAAVRAASEDELVAAATRRLARMRALGTTTAEVKSGYGLDAVSEATMLRAAHAAGAAAGVRVTGTCLALHALPPEAASAEAFVRLAIDEILPACADLATAADCFLERGAFSADECRPFLVAARDRGLRAADPRRPVLGVRRDPARRRAGRGVRRPPRADRDRRACGCWPRPAWRPSACRCARSISTCRCRRPGLSPTPAPRVVLATDFNPGSAPSESMLAAMNLACTQLKLSCAEALHAATIAPAAVLGLAAEVGQLAPGFAADIVLIDDPDWRTACYHLRRGPGRVGPAVRLPPLSRAFARARVAPACARVRPPVARTTRGPREAAGTPAAAYASASSSVSRSSSGLRQRLELRSRSVVIVSVASA